MAQIDVGRADDAVGITGTTETVSYLYSDHLMTTRLASDQRQAIIWRWQGEAFGNTQAIELATISINLRFPRSIFLGQYYDSETNLHYNHFRYYDPQLGRYITSDPIGLEGGMNTYGYVGGNPVMYYDPLGLYPGEQYVDYVGDAIGGTGDFIGNYNATRDADTIDGDKYFHCKANCEAAQRGEGGKDVSQCISDGREWVDQNIKGDPPSASSADQAANNYGRDEGAANPNGNCRQICLPYRPNGLPPQY